MTTTFINTPSTTVYGPSVYPSSGLVTAGLNRIDFGTNFLWDGSSNLFVETNFSIEYFGEVQNGVAAYYHTTAANLTAYAAQLEYHPEKAACAVLISTLIAIITIPFAVPLFVELLQ